MIRIEKENNGRIIVKFPYNPVYIAKIKTIKGYSWHPEEKYWSFQPNDGIVEKLITAFGEENVDIDSALQFSREDFEDLRRELVARKYSIKTIKAYVYYNKNFLEFIKKASTEVINEDIKDFLVYLSDALWHDSEKNTKLTLTYSIKILIYIF